MMMKKESDLHKENIEFLNKGGLQKDWDEKMLKKHFDPEVSPDKFQSPRPDNVFEQHSEFQSASAAVKSFTDDVDPSIELRASKPEAPQLDLIPTHEDSPAPAEAQSQATPMKAQSPIKVLPKLDEVKEVINQTAKKNPKEF